MASQSNMEILEAILNRELQSDQIEEINNLKKLNSYCPKDPDRVFLLDEYETPNLIGYISPSLMELEYVFKDLDNGATLIYDLFGVKIYKIN